MSENINILDSFTVEQLKSLAKHQGIKGYSKLKKEDLIGLISGYYYTDEVILEYLNSFNSYEAETFYKLFINRKLRLTSGNVDVFDVSMNLGYIEVTTEEETGYKILKMNERFEDVFCEWWDEGAEQHILKHRVLDYCIACTNLWGIAPAVKIAELLKINTTMNYTKDQVIEVAKAYKPAVSEDGEDSVFKVVADELVSDFLVANAAEADLRSQQHNKPFCFLPHEALLRYVYAEYSELGNEFTELTKFWIENIAPKDMSYTMMLEELALSYRIWGSIPQALNIILDYLDAKGYDNLSDEIISELSMKARAAIATIRTYRNRGYTDAEMSALQATEQPVTSTKQGRNETCACGSGKKYKKCCGR